MSSKIDIKLAKSKEDIRDLHKYLSQLDDIEVLHLGEFTVMCIQGRCYIARNEHGRVVASICMYEVKDYVFIAHWFINQKHRHTMLFKRLLLLSFKYAKDKNKELLTKLNGFDYSSFDGLTKRDNLVSLDIKRFNNE